MRKIVIFLFILVLLPLFPVIALAAENVRNVNVTFNPKTAGAVSQYNIGFSVSSSGALQGGRDEITLIFPEGTSIPERIDSSEIYINGYAVDDRYIYVDDNKLVLTLPSRVDVPDNGYVGIIIPQSVGIKNPNRGGNFTLDVYTSRDRDIASSNFYNIDGYGISSLDVTVSPAAVDEYAEFEISFRTSSEGALKANDDYIYIEFPEEMDLPRSIAGSNIKVDGKNPSSGGVTVDGQILSIRVPSDTRIGDRDTVKVNISSEARIRNPRQTGSYYIKVYTSKDVLAQSEKYTVGLAITSPIVLTSPDNAGQVSQYSIGFTTSTQGALDSGDYIYITFPSGTYVPSSISRSYITVNGYEAGSVSCSRSERKITVKVPSGANIPANSYVGIVIRSQAGVKNPGDAGAYQLMVSTSEDGSAVKSKEYRITGGEVSRPSVSLSTQKISEYPEINIEFKISSAGNLIGSEDTITLIFPEDFVLPSSIDPDDITVNDEKIEDYDLEDDRLTITVPEELNLDSGDRVKIRIKSDARIRNPKDEGEYTIGIYTSKDPIEVRSKEFEIAERPSVSNESPKVSISNKQAGQPSQYLVSFFTKSSGLDENDSIRISFPTGTTIPASITGKNILVNGTSVAEEDVQVIGYSIQFKVPEEENIRDNEKVVIIIKEEAGIKNPGSEGEYTLFVETSEDEERWESEPYSINKAVTSVNSNKLVLRVGSRLAQRGTELIQLDTAPTILNNFTVVPLRFLGDSLGATTTYDANSRVITVKYNNKELIFWVDFKQAKVNGQWVALDVPPTIINNRVMIPVRFVSTNFDATVNWNPDTREISIIK